MRAARIEVGAIWLQYLLRGWPMSRLETNCPADIEIVNATWEPDRNVVVLTAISSTFDDVPEGFVMPRWTPTATTYTPTVAEAVQVIMDAPDHA